MSEENRMDFAIVSRPALAGVKTGRQGSTAGAAGIVLQALPEGFLLHLLAKPGDDNAAARAEDLAARLGSTLRSTAPGQWYLAGDRALPPAEFHALETELLPSIALSLQSHGRIRVGVSGSAVEAMLAKLMAADLAETAFPVGHGTTLFAGHLAVHAQRLAADRFELTVLRGFALDIWESLVQASLEFGVDCAGPA